jgi:tripartite ATP-independent transporter DctM subunit
VELPMQARVAFVPSLSQATRSVRWLAPVERLVGRLVEFVVGLLVLAEVLILSAGIYSRYVAHRPLTWSDEVASILFLWLAMLGAAVAFRRSEHMRMAALVNRLQPRWRQFAEALSVAAGLLFFVLMMLPAIEFAEEAAFVVTPALQISSVWRAAALPVGFGLLLFFALTRLAASTDLRVLAGSLAVTVALAAAFWLLKPVFASLGNLNLVIFFFGIVVVLVFSGVPIAFAFGIATFGYLALATETPLAVMVGRVEEGMSHLILLAVPMFILLGALLTISDMARFMVEFLASLLGRVRGGLNYVLICAMYLVSGISGAKAADMAAIAPALFPEMQSRGEKPGELAALLAATGAQTETVPPSLVLITIGSVTGVSIAALFTGGLLPGLLLGAMLCVVVWRRARVQAVARPAATDDEARGATSRAYVIARAFGLALPALALPFIIRAAVIEGVATATEVSTVGIAYCVIVGVVIYRRFDWRRVAPMLVEAGALSGSILIIIGAATAMAWGLTQSGFSQSLAEVMSRAPGGATTFIVLSVLAFVVLGSVLEGIPAIVLFGPLLFPIARQLGIHEIHYSMVVILSMSLGLFSPPFGVGYYMACAIGRVPPEEGMASIWGYMAALAIGVVIVAAVPWISTGFL